MTRRTPPLLVTLLVLPALLAAAVAPAFAPAFAQNEPPPGVGRNHGDLDIVLIHGLGSSVAAWDDMAPYLMGTFRVFRFELAGHGSTPPVDDPTIDKETRRLGDFLAESGAIDPTLVGHGLGGMIALSYALDHPADVSRLILMDSAPRQLVDAEAKVEITKQMLDDYDTFVAERYLNMSPDPDITDRILDQALRTDSASFISLLMSSFDYDVTDRLRGLSVPMLVIGSELMLPVAERSREILDQIGFNNAPTLAYKRMGKTGHFVMLEQPVYIASVVLAFAGTNRPQFQD